MMLCHSTDYFAFVDLKTISETKTGVTYQSNFKATGDNKGNGWNDYSAL